MKFQSGSPLPRIPSASSVTESTYSVVEVQPKIKRSKRKKDKSSSKKTDKKTRSKKRVRSRSCPSNVLSEKSSNSNVVIFRNGAETPVKSDVRLPRIDQTARSAESRYMRCGSALSCGRLTRAATVPGCDAPTHYEEGREHPKKPKRAPLLVAVKPDNQESEREKFFKSGYQYNPQFTYRYSTDPAVMERMGQPSNQLLCIALKIIHNALKRHGSYEKFEEETGGKKLNRLQILEAAKRYLKEENLEAEVQVRLSEDLVARACMSRVAGRPTLQVRTHNIRENWIRGLLFHEIGTHFLRGSNNRQQPWCQWKKRRELRLRPVNPSEEGLASLHSLIFRPLPLIWKSSLLYYVTYKASEMSFVELFRDIGQFVRDPSVRWEYCLRAKRGQTDTSQPGTFCKDQVYLRGALDILKHRREIDFHMLVRCGKVDYRDLDFLKDIANLEQTRIPKFMEDLELYKKGLDDIVTANGLTDEDFEDL